MKLSVIFDLDNTLFDFDESEIQSIKAFFRKLKVSTPDNEEALVSCFLSENTEFWKERNEIGIEAVFERTVENVFAKELLGMTPPQNVGTTYLECFEENVVLEQAALSTIEELSKNYALYVVSNGLKSIQKQRLLRSELHGYFADVVVSGDIGHAKPGREIFDYLIKENHLDRNFLVYIGDSIRDDYHGAKNAGIRYIFYNRKGKEVSGIDCKQVSSLTELSAILSRL